MSTPDPLASFAAELAADLPQAASTVTKESGGLTHSDIADFVQKVALDMLESTPPGDTTQFMEFTFSRTLPPARSTGQPQIEFKASKTVSLQAMRSACTKDLEMLRKKRIRSFLFSGSATSRYPKLLECPDFARKLGTQIMQQAPALDRLRSFMLKISVVIPPKQSGRPRTARVTTY